MIMRLEKTNLLMPNVVHYTMDLAKENFDDGFEKMRSIEFQEEVYSQSALAFMLSESDKDQKTRKVEFYMFLSDIPDNFPYKTTKLLELKNAIVLRQADLEDNLEEARKKIEAFALDRYGKGVSDEMYCLNYDIYNELLVDVYIPMK